MNKSPVQKVSGIIQLLCATMILGVMIAMMVVAVGQSCRKTDTYESLGKKTDLVPVNAIKSGLNINTASKKDLMELPGIGDVTAQAIIDSRENDGEFYYLEDLMCVKGVGIKTFENIRSLIYVP